MPRITRDEILAAFPELTPETRDDGAIANALSVGRKRTISPTLIGVGTVLRTLGPQAGADFLDELVGVGNENNVVKWGVQMIQNSAFDIGDALSVAQINAFVGTLLSRAQADSLIALAVVPDPVSSQDVCAALEGWGDE